MCEHVHVYMHFLSFVWSETVYFKLIYLFTYLLHVCVWGVRCACVPMCIVCVCMCVCVRVCLSVCVIIKARKGSVSYLMWVLLSEFCSTIKQ